MKGKDVPYCMAELHTLGGGSDFFLSGNFWWPYVNCLLSVCWWMGAGFLLRILWCSQRGNHPKNNLAKFGLPTRYESSKRNGILLYSWLPTLELIIKIWKLEKKNLQKIFKIWQIWVISSMKNPFVICRNHIFQVEIWRKFASKRNTEWSWGFDTRTTSLVCIISFSIESKYPIPRSGWYENLKMYPISSRPGWSESFKKYPISSRSGWYEKCLKILFKYWNQIGIL
jgi:hypothetical protein